MEYEGAAFHSSLPKGRASGTVRIHAGTLTYESPHGSVQFALSDCNIECGGASNRLIFFTSPSQPNWKVYTADQSVLQDTELRDHLEAQKVAQRLTHHKIATPAIFLSIIGVIVFGFWSLWASRESLVEIAANQIPADWEVKAGDLFFEQIEKQTHIIDKPELTYQLTQLASPLTETILKEEKNLYPFKFHIAQDSQLNAFAMPGGHIVLNTGLILKADSAEEVLGVLAHEIAHVTRRHSLRQIIKGAGLFIIVQTFLGDLSGLLAVIADQGTFLLTQQFSRDYEREADEVGWQYLVQSNIDPRGLITFFEKLQEEHGSDGELEKALALLSTHPMTSERITRLEEMTKSLAGKSFNKNDLIDFKAFQKEILTLVVPTDEDGN